MTQFTVADLQSDNRLIALFGTDAACILELWVIEFKEGQAPRIAYARVTGAANTDNAWSASDRKDFKDVGDLRVQLVRVSLRLEAGHLPSLLQGIASGRSLQEIGEAIELPMTGSVLDRFGGTAVLGGAVVRPPMLLPQRQFPRGSKGRVSPHDRAGALSASVTPLAKLRLFDIDGVVDTALRDFVIEGLSKALNLDFRTIDAWRFGDLELLVFPTLTADERRMIEFSTSRDGRVEGWIDARVAQPGRSFLLQVSVLNDDCLVWSRSAMFPCAGQDISFAWQIPGRESAIQDTVEIDVWSDDYGSGDYVHLERFGHIWVREIHTAIVIPPHLSIEDRWVAHQARKSDQERVERAQVVSRTSFRSDSVVGGRTDDPWVSLNRAIASQVSAPPAASKSLARFFPRLAVNKTGRLELDDWLRDVLSKHAGRQVFWFDPYMEDGGIGIVARHAASGSRVEIVTGDEFADRISNLEAACKRSVPALQGVRLRVLIIPCELLHDRMLLVRDAANLPIAGYHLSNSVQKANENHPFLITEIPRDVLKDVLAYADQILAAKDGQGKDRLAVLFDSGDGPVQATHAYDPLAFLTSVRIGDVLAWWVGIDTLAGKSGDLLAEELQLAGLVSDRHLAGEVFQQLPAKAWNEAWLADDFHALWMTLGEVLANSAAGDSLHMCASSMPSQFADALVEVIGRCESMPSASSVRVPQIEDLVASTVQHLLKKAQHPERLFHDRRSLRPWGLHFAVKALWECAPTHFVAWLTKRLSTFEQQDPLARITAYSAIARIAMWGILRANQRRALLLSRNGFLRWLGYHDLKTRFFAGEIGAPELVGEISSDAGDDAISILCWMLEHAHRRGADPSTLNECLLQALPHRLQAKDARNVIRKSSGVCDRIGDCMPWAYEDVAKPLLEAGRVTPAELLVAWTEELDALWKRTLAGDYVPFRQDKEAVATEQASTLLFESDEDGRLRVAAVLESRMKPVLRTLKTPLIWHQNWNAASNAASVALWVRSFLHNFVSSPQPTTPSFQRLSSTYANAAAMSDRILSESRQTTAEELCRYFREKAG